MKLPLPLKLMVTRNRGKGDLSDTKHRLLLSLLLLLFLLLLLLKKKQEKTNRAKKFQKNR